MKYSLLILLFCCNCALSKRQESRALTDLGPEGNREVAAAFKNYLANRTNTCGPRGQVKRVIVTGFGLFSGADYNISGVVVESMANRDFFPDRLEIGTIPSQLAPADGRVNSSVATVSNRRLDILGTPYDVCFILFDVYWDLAGAILIHEMEKFRPDMVIMTGRGGTDWTGIFEAGAINHARDLAGFESDGRVAERNLPATMAAKIIADQDFESTIAMTWDRQKLADAARPIASTFGFFVTPAPATSYANTYICNNISYIVLSALRGESFYLAGDLIAVNPSSPSLRSDQTLIRYQGLPTIPAGFFHYPHNANNSSEAVFGWSRIIATAIHTSLK